jgi:hypothetical protein
VFRRIAEPFAPWHRRGREFSPAVGGICASKDVITAYSDPARPRLRSRVAETTVATKAYDLKGRSGVVIRVPERERTIERVSNGEINRELTILKRIFKLALQAGKILHTPHVPLLREDNTRTGFFELEQFRSVISHLPVSLAPVIEFAYITGWRIASEVTGRYLIPYFRRITRRARLRHRIARFG